MNTENKKRLLTDAHDAIRALGRILDGGHDFSQLFTFSNENVKLLEDSSLAAMAGLAILEAQLISEIGTDNL